MIHSKHTHASQTTQKGNQTSSNNRFTLTCSFLNSSKHTHTQTTTTTTKQEQYIQYVLRKFISKNPPAAQCVQCFTPLPNRPHMSPSWPGLRASDLLHLRLIFLAVNILELVVTGGGSKGINKSLEHHFKLFFCPLLFFKEVKFQYKGLSSRNVGYSGNLPSVKHRETFPTSKR